MPELPEVETTRRGVAALVESRCIDAVVVRERRLRWPVTRGLEKKLVGKKILRVDRRGKYLLLTLGHYAKGDAGTLLIHLGMSGRLCVIAAKTLAQKHDHVDIVLANSQVLRFTDPRRFGCVLWLDCEPLKHKLLVSLGPEPLGNEFSSDYLFDISRERHTAIKNLIMDSHVVVGVGNIYANETLFLAHINPTRPANSLDRSDVESLVSAIKQVLTRAIDAGGTTLRDFSSAEGKPGYFQQSLSVYGRGGQSCVNCGLALEELTISKRSTVFCHNCQK